ncbi:hypothetical protein P8605_27860, partial [Streptomyces sp. T-3]|nr:hypothetical protein [Streptomyces sp. T-3]
TIAVEEAWALGDVLNGDVIEREDWRWSDCPLGETLPALADPARAAVICLRLVQQSDEDTAECGVLAALELLDQRPSAHQAFAPVIEAARTHPDSNIRYFAADFDSPGSD